METRRLIRSRRVWRAAALALCLPAATAWAETREVFGRDYEVVGVRIAKSTGAPLANIRADQPKMLDKSVYIPAGTRLLLLRDPAAAPIRDRAGEPRILAATDSGLLVFVRENRPDHYMDPEVAARYLEEFGRFAVVQAEITPRFENDEAAPAPLGPTEVYRVVEVDGDEAKIELLPDPDRRIAAPLVVDVPLAEVAIIDRESFDVSRFPPHYEEYSISDQVSAVLAAASDLRIDEAERGRILSYLNNRLITEKRCEDKITISRTLGGSIQVGNDDKLWSIVLPIIAKAEISGKYNIDTEMAAGYELDVERFQRDDEVVEVEARRSFEGDDCNSSKFDLNIKAAASDGLSGDLNDVVIGAASLSANVSGQPVYRCRKEFQSLVEVLTQEQGLSVDIASLLIANYAQFKGARTPSECSPG